MKADLVVMMPVCKSDWHLAVRVLAWMKMIHRRADGYDLVLVCSARLTDEERAALTEQFPSARVFNPQGVDETSYFTAPNFMVKAALELMESDYPGRPMLWMEADCVPMRAGWVQGIEAEYKACGKPFLGDHVLGVEVPHLTGVAVYPPDWRAKAPSLATAIKKPDWGWDSQCSFETLPQSHRSKTIRQVWRPRPFLPETWRSVVGDDTLLFHQCKDGTLLDSVAEGLILPKPTQLEKSVYKEQPGVYGDTPPPKVFATVSNVEIFYVTYSKDIDFFRWSLDSVKKFAKGFTGITVAIPRNEEKLFEWVKPLAKVLLYDDTPGKGMLHHEVVICRADEFCPHVDAILHVDSDFCFWEHFKPSDYIVDGRPILYRETYEQAKAHNPNRYFWRETVTAATGIEPIWETMVRHPAIHLREVYAFTRKTVEQHTRMPFNDYVLSCRNEFPQTFCEFNTLGAVACRYFDPRYQFVHYDRAKDAAECRIGSLHHQYIYRKGRDKGGETWSHGGIKMYEAWLRQWVDGRPGAYWAK